MEEWRTIEEFPRYEVSDLGNIYNSKYKMTMRPSFTPFGHLKITLTDDYGRRHTRSVPLLVAEAFLEPPNLISDALIVKDGDFTNPSADNLAWRPQRFAWKYTRQMKEAQPVHYQNLMVENVLTGDTYQNIIDAGMTEGLLFDDIWRSTYTRSKCFPTGAVFEVIGRA